MKSGRSLRRRRSEAISLLRMASQEQCSVHGTGCTLAAAITAGLTQGKPLLAAIQQAKDYVTHAIQTSYDVGENCGVL